MYKHPIGDLIAYAKSLNISIAVPAYVVKNRMIISAWEAEGRYDVHMTVKLPQLEKCFAELEKWFKDLKKAGYK